MSFLYVFLSGILIGTAMIMPGVSGSVLAVVLGIYDKMIYSLNNLSKNFKKNIYFLFYLSIGVLAGSIWFSNILMFLYNKHEVITKFSFIGFILGGVPFLFKEIKKKNEKTDIKLLILTCIISMFIFVLSNKYIDISFNDKQSITLYFVSGIIYSIGKVIPGISGSFLLVLIGMYEFVLKVLSHPFSYGMYNLQKVIPFIIGLIIGVLILLRLISYLINKKFGKTYSIIIGFVISSIVSLVPNITFNYQLIISIFTMIICFLISYKLTK